MTDGLKFRPSLTGEFGNLDQALKQIQEFLRGLSLQQKALLAGRAAVGLILWLFVALLGAARTSCCTPA